MSKHPRCRVQRKVRQFANMKSTFAEYPRESDYQIRGNDDGRMLGEFAETFYLGLTSATGHIRKGIEETKQEKFETIAGNRDGDGNGNVIVVRILVDYFYLKSVDVKHCLHRPRCFCVDYDAGLSPERTCVRIGNLIKISMKFSPNSATRSRSTRRRRHSARHGLLRIVAFDSCAISVRRVGQLALLADEGVGCSSECGNGCRNTARAAFPPSLPLVANIRRRNMNKIEAIKSERIRCNSSCR